MSFRLITENEMSATAVDRWRKQYEHWSDDDRFSTPGKPSKGDVSARLNASDQTPAEIAEILNEGWARPKCDGCGEYVASAVLYKEEWGDGTVTLCSACLSKGLRMIGNTDPRP